MNKLITEEFTIHIERYSNYWVAISKEIPELIIQIHEGDDILYMVEDTFITFRDIDIEDVKKFNMSFETDVIKCEVEYIEADKGLRSAPGRGVTISDPAVNDLPLFRKEK